jgi:PLP dependent protein
MNAPVGIERNVRETLSCIGRAAELSGRDPASVTVVAVTKAVERPVVDLAYQLGFRHFGENRVQDAVRKFGEPLPADVTMHLIGHLQTNKANPAVGLFQVIESVDRISVVEALQRRAELAQRVVDILLQINVAGEPQKYGCAPAAASSLLRYALEQSNLRVRGLMTIAPLVSAPEDTRPVFRDLRLLRDDLQEAHPAADLPELSMGMTNDYEVAIEEGATLVRVGRALFGGG